MRGCFRLLEDRGSRGNGCLHLRVNGLLEADVEEVIARNLVVRVEGVIALDVVAGHGSGGRIYGHGHSEKFNPWCDGDGRKTQVDWGDLESDSIPRYLTVGKTMLLSEEVDNFDDCGWVKLHGVLVERWNVFPNFFEIRAEGTVVHNALTR